VILYDLKSSIDEFFFNSGANDGAGLLFAKQ
jgi:hypothetical protein